MFCRLQLLRYLLFRAIYFLLCLFAAATTSSAQNPNLGANRYFRIQILDEETGVGVPLVELRTTNDIRYHTDSMGNIAFFEPAMMDHEIYFHVQSHGYEYHKDGFGYRGAKMTPKVNTKSILKIKRINLAERMFRVTGEGIYRDSHLLGLPTPIQKPLLNGKVFGSDSVVNAIYHEKLFWFWGDTNRPSYPLGLFHVPGATSNPNAHLTPEQSPEQSPEQAIHLQYFVADDGFVKPMAQMPGDGPTWISGLTVVKDQKGKERMLATYVKVHAPMEVYQRGLAGFDDDRGEFAKIAEYKLSDPLYADGHSVSDRDARQEHIHFATPYPLVRVRATYESMLNLSEYESFTYFKDGSRPEKYELERDEQGKLALRWRRNTMPMSEPFEKELVKKGEIRPEESYFQMRSINSGERVQLASGSVSWNEHRKKWIMIGVQSFGNPSFLGEIWFSESDTLSGPWLAAKKIVTHDNYSFYNPKQHPYFDQDGGRVIFFEGTYTNMFTDNKDPTPRYNYNQIMYRLDLSDPRLLMPRHSDR